MATRNTAKELKAVTEVNAGKTGAKSADLNALYDYLGSAPPHGTCWFPFFFAFTTAMTALRVLLCSQRDADKKTARCAQ